MNDVRYYQDHDHADWIVRVWRDEDGKRRGEMWDFKDKEWFEADRTAWNVADEIYENHPLTEKMVEEITGVKL